MTNFSNLSTNNLPVDHEARMKKVLLSLEGLSLGDSFGQTFFVPEKQALQLINSRILSAPLWHYTDDTVMAISVVETLNKFGYIDQDYLAKAFSQRYIDDPNRAYGATARKIFRQISQGVSWQKASSNAFGGMGSMGNGGAMRSAPIGAYFFDDYQKAAKEAKASSEVTHSHLEGQAGAISVAVAAAYCARNEKRIYKNQIDLLEIVLKMTPDSQTRSRLKRAKNIDFETNLESVINLLGNGRELCSYDTVPIALWFVAHNPNNFKEAIWKAVTALGDRDTICAIVGSIVALAVGTERLPQTWLNHREKLELSF